MSDPRHVRARELFLAAVGLDGEERSALLLEIGNEDPDLRAEVEDLLDCHAELQGSSRADLGPLDALRDPETAGSLPEIDGYRIVRRIGEGGMGSVYEAEQLHPVRRSVAIKLLKRGLDTRQIVRRFEAERQALAMMDHPNIARVLDAGESRSGQPYFAMELVRGEPITRFCDRRRLNAAQRLPLFVAACEAVQHAHQKGIIHRDIKPSNVLVESFESRSVVKVIDFGIAKALRPTGDDTAQTRLGQLLGTPEYMSPEQADPTAVDIDTRTDVYSLGVVLYELLTGSLPLERERARELGAAAVLRALRGQTPARPSLRVSSLGERARSVARERQTDPPGLTRLLRRELDWICLKALDLERERRYASASELAADIERYLRQEPVLAGPPSALYRFRTFARRHRLAVSGALALAAVVLVALLGITVALVRAQRAEAEARKQERSAREVASFLLDIFKSSDPYEGEESEPTASELLERGAQRIEQLEGDPEVQASLMRALGQVYSSLGRYDEATPLLQQAVSLLRQEGGPDDELAAAAAATLAWTYRESGRIQEAEPLLEQAIAVLENAASPDLEALAEAHMTLGVILRDRNELAGARIHLERSLALREQSSEPNARALGFSLYHLGWLENKAGRYREAERRYLDVLDAWLGELGPSHPSIGWTYNDLGAVMMNLGRLDESRNYLEQSLEIQESRLGPDHPGLAAPLQNFGNLLSRMGQREEALARLQRALAIREQALGPLHLEVAGSLEAVAGQLQDLDRLDEARRHYERAGNIFRTVVGEESADYAEHLNLLAGLLRDMGENERSLALSRRALAIQERALGPEHPVLAFTATNLAVGQMREREYADAARLFERAAAIREKALGEGPDVAWTLCKIGDARALLGEEARARAVFARAFEILAVVEGTPDAEHQVELACLLEEARALGRFGDRDRAIARLADVRDLIERQPELETGDSVQAQASVWCLLGERERTLAELRRAVHLGYEPQRLASDPEYEHLIGDPGFEALLAASGD